VKEKYQVKINWQGEVHEFWTKAQSESHALSQAMSQLATKLKRTLWYIRNNVKNYEVQKEVAHG